MVDPRCGLALLAKEPRTKQLTHKVYRSRQAENRGIAHLCRIVRHSKGIPAHGCGFKSARLSQGNGLKMFANGRRQCV